MKQLLLTGVFLSFTTFAAPLDQMNQRLSTYAESVEVACAAGEKVSEDDGLFVDVSCRFKCSKGNERIERMRGTFIPKSLGLYPGNGSNGENTIWSSVGITLKNWSQRLCLEKASESCEDVSRVEEVAIAEIESGKWKLEKFPGCQEKSITLSPFDNKSQASRIYNISPVLSKLNEDTTNSLINAAGLRLPRPQLEKVTPACQYKIRAQLCYGDCVDLSDMQNSAIVETLGTAGPLGSDEMEICGDTFIRQLRDKKLSKASKQILCEAYFWSALASEESMVRSCAALRGDVACEGI